MTKTISKACRLFNVWLICAAVALSIARIYVIGFAPKGGNEPVLLPWQYQTIVILAIIIFFYPFLFWILYHATREKNKALTWTACGLIVFLSLFLIGYFYLLLTNPVGLLT